MKNILLISGNRISPAATGGQVHTFGIARALARMGFSVHIFSIAGRKEDYSLTGIFRGYASEHGVEPRLSEEINLGLFFGVLQACARRLDYSRLWQHALLSRGVIPQRLKNALHRADIILSDLPYCPPIPGPWRDKPWFLVSHNLEHKLLEQESGRQRQFAGAMYTIESTAPQVYSDIIACAPEDQSFFRAHDLRSQLSIPMVRCGVDPADYSVSAEVRERVRADLGFDDQDWVLMFSGSGFGPNVDALKDIKEFCSAEAAFLAEHHVRFLVVGSVSPAFKDGALVATGRVSDVVPYFAAADAGINLVTRGSGSNVKIFEYLAAKLPVISTTFGVRGTELIALTDYLPCSKADLRQIIETFISRDRAYWREYGDAVWGRHRRSCDIQDLVRDAVATLPAFQHSNSAPEDA